MPCRCVKKFLDKFDLNWVQSIPGNDVTLNGPALVSEAKEEQSALREELKTVFDELVYGKLAEGDAAMQESINTVFKNIPHGIYVG